MSSKKAVLVRLKAAMYRQLVGVLINGNELESAQHILDIYMEWCEAHDLFQSKGGWRDHGTFMGMWMGALHQAQGAMAEAVGWYEVLYQVCVLLVSK